MKKTIVAAFVALVALSSSLAFASGAFTQHWGVITQLEDFGDDLYVHGLDLSPNPAGCASPNYASFLTTLTPAKKEGLRLMLTAAFAAGREVRLRLDDSICP